MASHVIGTVYLLHFDRPYKHARHYLGWAVDLDVRLAQHGRGHGARLIAVITAAGIGYQLARTWPGVTRYRERQLKRMGGASRRCPICHGFAPGEWPPPRASAAVVAEAEAIAQAAADPWAYDEPF